jgi:hypothetical protein
MAYPIMQRELTVLFHDENSYLRPNTAEETILSE